MVCKWSCTQENIGSKPTPAVSTNVSMTGMIVSILKHQEVSLLAPERILLPDHDYNGVFPQWIPGRLRPDYGLGTIR